MWSNINVDFILGELLSCCICLPPLNLSIPFGIVCGILFTSILIIVFPLLVFCCLSSLPFEPIFPLFTHSITYSFQSVCQDNCHVQGDTQVNVQWENILLLLCVSHILDLSVFLLGDVKSLEVWTMSHLSLDPHVSFPARLSRYPVGLWRNSVYF